MIGTFSEKSHDAMILRGQCLQNSRAEVAALLEAAFEEDEREQSRFDRTSWFNFFPEDIKANPQAVEDAWREYDWYWSDDRRQNRCQHMTIASSVLEPNAAIIAANG